MVTLAGLLRAGRFSFSCAEGRFAFLAFSVKQTNLEIVFG